jgi:DEAD/DEAH box helicase domain-containing protein
VLVKEVLRQAFAAVRGLDDTSGGDNVHGEFGLATDWPNYATAVAAWLDVPVNQDTVRAVIRALSAGTVWAKVLDTTAESMLLEYVRSDALPEISKVALDASYTQEALSERLANAGLLPMFGFPTRVRPLYTRWPKFVQKWPPEEGLVDRDIDIAISQFAPGSQTVKDKAVHTAIGVVELRPAGNTVQSADGLYPSLPKGNTTILGMCEHCQAVVSLPASSTPAPGGAEPVKRICPVCLFSEPSLREIDAREPKGFFTDLEPQDFDGQFEWQPRSTRPSMAFDAGATDTPTLAANCSLFTLFESIISVNDNGGVGGFDFQAAKVDGVQKDGAYAVAPSGDDAAQQSSGGRVSTTGTSWRISLLARRKTDILLTGINKWPTGVFADPTTVEGRAAWYSFSFWLRLAAGAHMDVDALELQAGIRTIEDATFGVAGQAFLCDKLENGAGYSRFLGQAEEFSKLLEQLNAETTTSLTSKWISAITSGNSTSGHGVECDSSCNICLRDFNNLPYHGLLDWRLALDMARLAASESASIDLVSNWGPIANPWSNLLVGSNPQGPAIMKRLGYGDPVQFGGLRGYVHQTARRATIQIECHPLWRTDHPEFVSARLAALGQYPNYQVGPLNPYRLVRRPSDYI